MLGLTPKSKLTRRIGLVFLALGCAILLSGFAAHASDDSSGPAQDPGVRTGPSQTGKPLAGLTAGELSFFTRYALPTFNEVETVAQGLGPRFNANSCAACHAYPVVGGSSPATNPLVVAAANVAPGNTLPPFLTLNSPIRVARFVHNADGSPDGSVHDLFTITGRADSPAGCAIKQPDFSDATNLGLRIPTPLFGLGLVEAIPDAVVRANLTADIAGFKARNGIAGRLNAHAVSGALNANPNDGEITRFGWKAQNVSLLLFAGEAYNVEMGVTNELFPNEREEDPACTRNATPESDFGFEAGDLVPSDLASFRGFMRFLAPPLPTCQGNECSPSIQHGHALAATIGCLACHTETLTTGLSSTAALSQQPVHLFSDLAVHHMGRGLADGITQGLAGPDEFRSAPLWGLGERVYFLHDGRTHDLVEAIAAHRSEGSEANRVIENFNHLSNPDQEDLLKFLRSL